MSGGVHMFGQRAAVNDKAVNALAKTLAEAKQGRVQLVAIIAVGEDGNPNVIFGGDNELVPSVNLGADILKHTVMTQILSAPKTTAG